MKPIGYVVMLCLRDSTSWESTALTRLDDGKRQLMVRTCFSMFPSQSDAEAALMALEGHPAMKGAEATIRAVFPSNIAAPHKAAREGAETTPNPPRREE